jgi:hypothetical protein
MDERDQVILEINGNERLKQEGASSRVLYADHMKPTILMMATAYHSSDVVRGSEKQKSKEKKVHIKHIQRLRRATLRQGQGPLSTMVATHFQLLVLAFAIVPLRVRRNQKRAIIQTATAITPTNQVNDGWEVPCPRKPVPICKSILNPIMLNC